MGIAVVLPKGFPKAVQMEAYAVQTEARGQVRLSWRSLGLFWPPLGFSWRSLRFSQGSLEALLCQGGSKGLSRDDFGWDGILMYVVVCLRNGVLKGMGLP